MTHRPILVAGFTAAAALLVPLHAKASAPAGRPLRSERASALLLFMEGCERGGVTVWVWRPRDNTYRRSDVPRAASRGPPSLHCSKPLHSRQSRCWAWGMGWREWIGVRSVLSRAFVFWGRLVAVFHCGGCVTFVMGVVFVFVSLRNQMFGAWPLSCNWNGTRLRRQVGQGGKLLVWSFSFSLLS